MNKKGIILAGGTGSRLDPLTRVTNKHLLPIYDKPMIYYPIQTLKDMGINDIIIVSGRGHAGHFLELLGSGETLDIKLHYAVQERAGGIAEALNLTKPFIDESDTIVVILGDNIYLSPQSIGKYNKGCQIYLTTVSDPERFGVVKFNDKGGIEKIIEKPLIPPSNQAVTGLYIFDYNVYNIINTLSPSHRGELEIVDAINDYLYHGNLTYETVNGDWSDAGTIESLYEAATVVRNNKK